MTAGCGSSFDLQRSDIAPESADFYWVNQQNQAEIVDEYVRASVDNVWLHDLTKLTPGDVIFHNYEGEIIGYSLVESLAETFTVRPRNVTTRRSAGNLARVTAGEIASLAADKGYDWIRLLEKLREEGVSPLIKHREFRPIDCVHNARINESLYG